MSRTEALPRLCFVGPLLGRNEGWVLSQGEILADLFASDGYTVHLTSGIPYRFLRMADIIRSLIFWRKSYDIANLAVFSGPGFLAVDIASMVLKRLGKPAVFVLRGGNLIDFAQHHPQWTRQVLRRSQVIVSPSEFLAQFFRNWGFRVKTIPNVLAIENYTYRQRDKVKPCLLWMRTFHPIYNPQMAVETLRELHRSVPQARLTMAGQEKGVLEAMKQMVAHDRLEDSIRFAGYLDLVGKQREFPAHDIFLNTNRVDNMPVSVIEAAAFGLPVVATDVGGIPYLLSHDKSGLLVKNEDAVGMADAIKRLLSDPQLCARLSKNGRLLAESCSWTNVKKEWEKVFAEIV